jgi:hypothetical protein
MKFFRIGAYGSLHLTGRTSISLGHEDTKTRLDEGMSLAGTLRYEGEMDSGPVTGSPDVIMRRSNRARCSG